MPTRSYYFPKEFSHIEALLNEGENEFDDANIRKFRERNIAPLFSGMDLAIVLGIGPGLLISILRKQHRHYRRFPLTKGDGTIRLIASPRTYLKVIQWWLLDNILNKLEVHDSVYGFVKGRSIYGNAQAHLGSKHFLNVDIKSFFDSVDEAAVKDIFTGLGYSGNTSTVLAHLCCLNGSLPQGAPTSPAIGNQILKPLDYRISKILHERGYKYTRYADDITVSGREWITEDILELLATEVSAQGFELKAKKTRFSGPGDRNEVTGLIVGDFVQPPRIWRKKTRAALHRLSSKGLLQPKDKNYLLGIIGFCGVFPDSTQMQRLSEEAKRILG